VCVANALATQQRNYRQRPNVRKFATFSAKMLPRSNKMPVWASGPKHAQNTAVLTTRFCAKTHRFPQHKDNMR